jgi:hypothetical protein
MNLDEESAILAALEPTQRTATLSEPLPRRRLGTGTLLLLWILRIYVLLAVPLVIYTFVQTLTAHHAP